MLVAQPVVLVAVAQAWHTVSAVHAESCVRHEPATQVVQAVPVPPSPLPPGHWEDVQAHVSPPQVPPVGPVPVPVQQRPAHQPQVAPAVHDAQSERPEHSSGTVPVSVGKVPVSRGGVPVSVGKVPVSVGRVPVSVGKVPVSVGRVPVSVGRVPVSVGRVPVSIVPTGVSPVAEGVSVLLPASGSTLLMVELPCAVHAANAQNAPESTRERKIFMDFGGISHAPKAGSICAVPDQGGLSGGAARVPPGREALFERVEGRHLLV